MQLSKEFILEEIQREKGRLRELGVKKLLLFGSYARDEQREDSDIDFLVEFKKERGNYKVHLNLLHILEDLFGKKIDLGVPHKLKKGYKEEIAQSHSYETRL